MWPCIEKSLIIVVQSDNLLYKPWGVYEVPYGPTINEIYRMTMFVIYLSVIERCGMRR